MRVFPSAVSTLIALAALGMLESVSFAQATPRVDPAVAKHAGELFHAGRVAAAAGDDKTACARFNESEQLQPAPGTQLNLGSCEARQGHLLAAREHFRKAGAGFAPDDERRAVAVNSANDLTERLAMVTVHLAPGLPPDTRVALEGAPLDTKVLEKGIEVDPGKTKLTVTVTGHQPRDYELELNERDKREVTAEAGDPIAPAVAPVVAPPASGITPEDERASKRNLERTLGYVGVGVGGAGIVLGSVFGALALHEASVVKANCSIPSYACKPAGVSAASSGSTDGIVSTAMFITGGVFAAAGVFLIVTTRGDDSAAKPASTGRLVLSPMALRSGGGASGTWTF